jgi:hypothetical protein
VSRRRVAAIAVASLMLVALARTFAVSFADAVSEFQP